jgi:hypothetical protein
MGPRLDLHPRLGRASYSITLRSLNNLLWFGKIICRGENIFQTELGMLCSWKLLPKRYLALLLYGVGVDCDTYRLLLGMVIEQICC